MRLIILGSTGMLGQEVARCADRSSVPAVGVARKGPVEWDASRSTFQTLCKRLEITESDVVVNCIGWIPQKSSGDPIADTLLADRLNRTLIGEIAAERQERNFGWVQIATDCVFSSSKGPHFENSASSPNDLYGESKVAGEKLMHGAMKIRCSIIGHDSNYGSGLFEWFRRLPKGESVRGYTNAFWNGVSTLSFARLTIEATRKKAVSPGNHHWIPNGSVTKFELLQIFKGLLGRKDLSIVPTELDIEIDRVLGTNSPEQNQMFWQYAGHRTIPTIESLCDEMIRESVR